MFPLLLSVLVAALVVWVLARVSLGYGASDPSLPQLSAREATFLGAAADAVFPPGGVPALSGAEAGVVRHIDRWLALLTRRNRILIRLLLVFFEHATLLFPAPGRGGRRRFSSLSVAQRMALLEDWEHSPLRMRRIVFASLRTILTSSYFASPDVLRELGLAPLDIESPVVEADLLYPRVGQPHASIRWNAADVARALPKPPLDPRGPLHPDYRGPRVAGAPGEERA